MPDGTELHADADGTVTGTRYYSFGGATTAVRTGDGVRWLVADQVGTDSVQVDAKSLEASFRYTDPFGAARSSLPDWVGDHGFVGGITNADTGLTTLGARQYDPDTGRFISADPIADPSDPQQLNGYAYASNSPVTHADPSGTMAAAIGGGTIWDDGAAGEKRFVRYMDAFTGGTAWRRDYYALNKAWEADKSAHDPDGGHELLSWVGYVPVIGVAADAANAVWYGAEGRGAKAAEYGAYAVIGVIPFGKVLKIGGKLVVKGSTKAVKIITKSSKTASKAVKSTTKKAAGKALAKGAGKQTGKATAKDTAKAAGKSATSTAAGGARDAARRVADASAAIRPSAARPAVAEAIQLSSGRVIANASVRGSKARMHPAVQSVLNTVSPAARGAGHGQCGLAVCLSQALFSGESPMGADAAAVLVRGDTGHPKHGLPVGPCQSCQVLSRHFNLNFLTGD